MTVRLRAGLGRASITVYEPGFSTFGWGYRIPIEGVARPLFARALCVEDTSGRRIVYVCCDLGMISESLRDRVLERLPGLHDDEVMITATHTHSGPSGFSTYFMYSCSTPGFSVRLRDAIAEGIVSAIEAAIAALRPARLYLHAAELPIEIPIAWNRSIEAYSANRDTSPLSPERRDEAVDRTMTVLRVDAEDGSPLGLVSWLGLHGTSLHRENRLIHGDNKGEAAAYVEARAHAEGHREYVAIFAQGASGDVSPNYRFDPRRGVEVGRYDDDHESARWAGAVQARHAIAIAKEGTEVTGTIDARIERTDFFDAPVDPAFVFGRDGLRTSEPRLGLAFACGTPEGPGPLASLRRSVDRARAASLAVSGDPKVTWCELGSRHRFLGAFEGPARALGWYGDGHLPNERRTIKGSAPWVPRMLPAQLLTLGPLAIAAIPGEPTTVAGRRIARVIERGLGARRVVVNGCANGYASYVTTPEEYALQRYEGASTLFGPHTLPAWCTAFASLTRAMQVTPVARAA